MTYRNVGDYFDAKAFEAAADKFARENDICPKCVGVGCKPEAFGMGNPHPNKKCPTCKGVGSIKKESIA